MFAEGTGSGPKATGELGERAAGGHLVAATWNSMGIRRTAVMEARILLNESRLLNPLGTGRQSRELAVEVADTLEQAQS